MGFGGSGFKGGAGDLGSDLKINDGTIKVKEQANAESDTDAYGQIWVKTASPNQLYFTTDAGDDIQITSGTGLAAAASSAAVNADDIQTGDAAVTIDTTVGNITLDAQATNADVIIKVDDADSSVTAVTFDGSDAGRAIFNGTITLGSDADGTDREIVFGHATLKTIMGIDDSADAFVINTDDAFDGTLANNSLSIDASHNMIVAGNITSGGSFVIGSADMSETDLEKLDGITDGTAAANKAVVLDGSKNIATIGTVGCGAITSTGASTYGSLAGGALSGSSTLEVVGAVTSTGAIASSGSITSGGSFIIGSADMNETDLEKLDGITNGTATANKAVVLDGSKDIATLGAVTLASVTGSKGRFDVANGNLLLTGTLDVGGASLFNGNATFGADDTGVDVRIFSATTNEGILYDASQDELGLLLTTKLSFHDIGGDENILASANGHLEINAGTTLDMTAPTVDVNASTAVTIDTPGVTITDTTTTSATEGGYVRLAADDSAVMADGHRLGVIEFAGAEDANSTISVGARIEALCRDAWDGSNNDANLLFYTTDGTTQSEVLKLDADKLATFSGASLFKGNATFGVDDTGVDVRMFSATADEGVLYDASEDELALLLTTKLKFHDVGGGEEIYASANGHLEVNAGTTLDMTAPTVDVNASTAVTIDTPGVTITDTTATSATEGGYLRLAANDGAVMADNHRLGVIEFAGAEDTSNTISIGARIQAICRDAWDGSNNDADLEFYTTDGTTESLVLTLDADKLATFAGTTQFNGNATFGVDDTGVDVRMYSATTNEGVLYDASQDELGLLLTTKLSFHDIGGDENILASSDGHLEVNAGTTLDCTAPTIDLNASTALTVDGPSIVLANTATNTPVVQVLNTHNGATGGILRFVNDKGGAGADDDVCGTIQFYGDDDAQDNIEFASITAQVADASNGAEGGRLILKVATHDGETQPGLTIVDGSAEDEVDVTIGNGAASVTTTAGVLKVVGNVIQASDGGSTITMDDDDNVTIAGKIVGPQEIEQASDGGGSCLLIDNDDTDQIALNIDAANIDGNVLQIAADAVTTAQGIQLSVDALTSGGGIFIESTSNNLNGGYMGHFKYNGTSTNNNSIIKITNDHASATATIPIEIDQDSTGPVMKVNYGANGSAIALSVKEVDITLSTSGTSTTTNSFIPAGAVVIGLGVRVITAIDNNGFISNIGVGSNGAGVSANKNYFGQASDGVLEEQDDTAVLFPGNIADDGTSLYNVNAFGAATPLVITTNAQPSTGEVRVALYYYQVTPPQSN